MAAWTGRERHAACHDFLLHLGHDQLDSALGVPRQQRVVHCLGCEARVAELCRSAAVKRDDPAGAPPAQLALQELLKQLVIAVPVAFAVQWQQEQILVFQ